METKIKIDLEKLAEKHKVIIAEKKAWTEIFDELEKLGFDKETLNSKKFRPLFVAVEKWGFHEHERRKFFDDEKAEGVFWNREEGVRA